MEPTEVNHAENGHRSLTTQNAPQALGPYSQGVATQGLVFISGQLPIHPSTGQITGETAREQASRALQNMEAILTSEGMGLQHVVKTSVFLSDLADFEKVNAAYANAFLGPVHPARSTFQIAALPRGARVEIEAIAMRAGAGQLNPE